MMNKRFVGVLGRRFAHTARSIVFANHGTPKEVLNVVQHEIPDAQGKDIVLRLVGAPINPADINQIEGVYPSKPHFNKNLGTKGDVAVPGNEGLFEVIEVGDEETEFKVGDWAIPKEPSFGTWASHKLTNADHLIRIADKKGLDPISVATVAVNPSTAFRILRDYGNLEPGDFFIQNGGNSGVGRMAIQIAKAWGIKSISVVRDRRDIDTLKQELIDLGADYVITEEQVADKSIKHIINDWTRGNEIKLALNCVGGRSASNIARQLGQNGEIVTYGGMSKQPVSLGTAMYIFKNIKSSGFWMTRYANEYPKSRVDSIHELLDMFRNGELKTTAVNTQELDFEAKDSDFFATFEKAIESHGKQVVVAKTSN